MEIANNMRGITENIVTSYDARVRALGDLVVDTRKSLKGFASDRKKMAREQAETLKKGETDRLKSFKVMMGGIQKDIKDIETYVKKLLGEYSSDMKKAANAWQGMSKTMARARKGMAVRPKVEAKVKVRPVKEAVK